jgi:nicotinamidase-related amidase
MITINANPFPFKLDMESAALLIIDMQRDFVEPGGFGESLGNTVEPLQSIVPTVKKVLDAWRLTDQLVVHTRESHLPDLSDCPEAKLTRGNPSLRIGDLGPMGRILIRDEPGNQIVEELAPLKHEVVIDKPGKGAFYGTQLLEILNQNQIRQLIVMGVTTEVCVQSTMREANDRGFDCLLIEDATASYFPEFKAATLAMVTAQAAIVGWTCSSQLLIQSISS